MNDLTWIKVADILPENGKVVETKIDDSQGERGVQKLMRKDKLWWHSDGLMYVYYTPTHWRNVKSNVTSA